MVHREGRTRAALATFAACAILSACLHEDTFTPVDDTDPIAVVQKKVTPTGPRDLALFDITPDRGPATGFTQVEIRGEGLTEVKRVLFGGSEALEFLAIDDELIVAYSPPRPHGRVDLKVVDEEGRESILESAFMYEDEVQVAQVTPGHAHLFGGESVTVYGRGFSEGSVVLFGDKKSLATEIIDSHSLVAVLPEGDEPGPVDVLVSNDSGTGVLSDGLSYVVAPKIFSVSPPAAPLGGSTTIDIHGDAFFEPLLVTVAGEELIGAIVHDQGHIEVVVPASDTPESVAVAVATSFGATVLEAGFTFFDSNETGLLGIAPHSGTLRGGQLVTLALNTTTPAGQARVFFGANEAEVLETAWETYYLLVRTPPGDALGSVDVLVESGDFSDVLQDGYTYLNRPHVIETNPNFGGTHGGTRVVIRGTGFQAGAAVRIGALAATDIEVLDSETIEATTPKGAPGLANVTVIQEGHFDTLLGGFLYQAPTEIWAVSPPTGAMAGGTLVTLHGNGLESATAVLFGGYEATVVEAISPTKILLLTPPSEVGSVTVRVEGTDGVAHRENAFTYYDPSSDGGLWGGPIDRSVNVTVFDLWFRDRLPGARVLLGSDPNGPHRGVTDANGQITFAGLDLSGPQLLTVTKDGYQIGSLVGFDAQNVAFGLEPVPTCEMISDMPCDPPGGEGAIVDVGVSHLIKGVKTPWGDCADHVGLPGGLCEPCTTDADCDHGLCSTIPEVGSFCTFECQKMSDCPEGFLCLPLPESKAYQCIPSAGEYRTFCDITLASMGAEDPIAWPGIPVDDLGNVELVTRLGDFAIFCWSGMYKEGRFTPELLGVARGLSSSKDGEVFEVEVEMKYPLKQEVEIVLDRPAIGPSEEEETIFVRIALDLGSEGILDFPNIIAQGREKLLTTLPPSLTGELYNARYTLVAEAKSSFEPDASSVTIESGLYDIRNDWAWRRQGQEWIPTPVSTDNVNGMAAAQDVVFAVGDAGLVLRSFGEEHWAHQASGTKADLHAVTMAGEHPIAGGEGGLALHFDGVTWKEKQMPVEDAIVGLWAVSENEVFGVAGKNILTFDGESWVAMLQAPADLQAIWAESGSSVWVAGDGGYIGHYDGESLTGIGTGLTHTMRAIWGREDGAIVAAGDGGSLLLISGGTIDVLDTGLSVDLHGIWGEANDVWIVGAYSTILHLDSETLKDETPDSHGSTLRAIAGQGDRWWTMGDHELVLGPMMAIPETVLLQKDADGNTTASWETQEGTDSDFNLLTAGSSVGPCEACGMLFMLPYREWRATIAGGIEGVTIPNLSSLVGKSGLAPGNKNLTVYRALTRDPFDFDDNTGDAFLGAGWKSWATNAVAVPID